MAWRSEGARAQDELSGQLAAGRRQAAAQPAAVPAPAPPARFQLIYESRDGRFCLFQDADGHLTAVSSASLA